MPKGAVTANGMPVDVTENNVAHTCNIPGCVAHIAGDFDTGEHKYQILAHFKSQEHMLECAIREVVRRAQLDARKKEFPNNGKVVDVDYKGKCIDSVESLKAKFDAMSAEEKTAKLAELELMVKLLGMNK